MDLISRDFINRDLQYLQILTDRTMTWSDMSDEIDFWKVVLYEGYNMRPGMSMALIDHYVPFHYCSLFFAAAELGLKILIFPEKPTQDDGYSPKIQALVDKFGQIDLIYYDEMATTIEPIIKMCHRYGRQTIASDVYDTYTVKNNTVYNAIAKKIFAKPEDVLVWTTTSGSTGEAKLLEYTHQQLYRISVRNAEVFDLDNQRICHSRNMHHAAVLMINFLPGFYGCPYHFGSGAAYADGKEFAKYVVDHRITRLMVSAKYMLDDIVEYMLENNLKFDFGIEIITGGFYLTEDYVEKVKQTNIKKLFSMFGSNETYGPVFLKEITPTTSTENYKPNYMGNLVDSMFKVELNGTKLTVSAPTLYSNSITIDDDFEGKTANGFYHLGRNNFYRINEDGFTIPQLQEIVSKFATDFDIVVDMPKQQLYLVIWSGTVNIAELNYAMLAQFEHLIFNKVDFLTKKDFQDFKIEHDMLRTHFQNM
jgi:acyl-coenzyme A synthetase/AMP-(fatty) acid ligase